MYAIKLYILIYVIGLFNLLFNKDFNLNAEMLKKYYIISQIKLYFTHLSIKPQVV